MNSSEPIFSIMGGVGPIMIFEDAAGIGVVCPSSIVCEGLKMLLQVDGSLRVNWCLPNWSDFEGLSPVSLVVCTTPPIQTELPWLLLDENHSPTSGAELRSQVAAALGQSPPPAGLTPKELQLLRLLAQGVSRQSAAYAMHVSENTVKSHLGSMYRKLRVNSRTQAVIEGAKRGLVSIGAEEA